MDDLIKDFIDETVESLQAMDADLVVLERDPQNKELLGNVFRVMHTIKGTCGFIGLARLEKVAHAAENMLHELRSGGFEINETSMTILFMCIDRVRYLVGEINKSGAEPSGDDHDIISMIEATLKGACHAPVPEVAPAQHTESPAVTVQAESKTETPLESREPEPVKSAVTATAAEEKAPEYLRVQVNILEELINMVSELVLTRNQLLQLVRAEETSSLKTPLQRLNRIVSDLQDSVMKTRMQPIGNAWAKLPRIVRDLSSELKKKINLEMEGEDTELDRQVLELIKDPLIHMVRNSCDHGIETPELRAAAGKKEAGTIRVKAYHEGGFVIIKITDDGRGLNVDKIAAKAVERGLIDRDQVASMSTKQILACIMKPGFSTAEHVTNVSGRGVGMDVVRANIEKIGGTIDMDSFPGRGTSFTIQIPLTLAIISSLIVGIDGGRYAIPQMNIQELVSLDGAAGVVIEKINDKPVLRLRDRIISLLDSRMLFGRDRTEATDMKDKLIAVISAGASYYGIILDRIYDTEEVVIKAPSSAIKSAGIFSGNTILGDGQVIMILDPAAISRRFNVEKDSKAIEFSADDAHTARALRPEIASMLVFNAGAGAAKAIPLELVSRLHVFNAADVTRSADKMVVTFNNHLMELVNIEGGRKMPETGEFMAIILSDDRSESAIGIIIDEVIDIISGELDITPATRRPGVLGSMRLGDYTVDLIDITHYLSNSSNDWFSVKAHQSADFATESAVNGHAGPDKTKILVVDDSNFFRSMLANLLSAEGYDVTVCMDAQEAIRLHDEGYMFDVVLSDIEMPGLDGFAFVERMRQSSAWRETPFIAITSHNTPRDVETGMKKGFNDYIGKFDKAQLMRSISGAIN